MTVSAVVRLSFCHVIVRVFAPVLVVAAVLAVSGCSGDAGASAESPAGGPTVTSDTQADAGADSSTDAADDAGAASVTIDPRLANWPPVRARPSELAFGDVRFGEPVTKYSTLVNASDKDVTILHAATNCGCTTADIAGMVVPANGSVEIPVNFDADDPIGKRHATVTLLFEGYENPIRFNVTAFVIRK